MEYLQLAIIGLQFNLLHFFLCYNLGLLRLRNDMLGRIQSILILVRLVPIRVIVISVGLNIHLPVVVVVYAVVVVDAVVVAPLIGWIVVVVAVLGLILIGWFVLVEP